MYTKQNKRRTLWLSGLSGPLVLLLFGLAGLFTLTFGSSDIFHPDTTKEMTMMNIAHAATTAEKARPPIDLAAAAQTQTATFALG